MCGFATRGLCLMIVWYAFLALVLVGSPSFVLSTTVNSSWNKFYSVQPRFLEDFFFWSS